MLASFLITYHTHRIDNLLQTIRFLEKWHYPIIKDSELILLCQDRCGSLESQFKKTSNYNFAYEEMQQAHQINFGMRKAQSDLIVLMESDRILPSGYFDHVFSQIKPKEMITTEHMKRSLQMISDVEIESDVYESKNEDRTTNNKLLNRNMFSGNVTFWKKDFLDAGGADEAYVGYGWLDHDLTSTMQSFGVKPIYLKRFLELHLYHEPMTYGSKDQKSLFIKNGIHYCNKWKVPYPIEFIKEIKEFSKGVI